ncbi:hypothetical protein PANT_6c00087 [Moesziomyces antarcticus T-34]|uniref:Uncharacterized protein n=1 Tax=Pseudozyma antarctica (strain T-34) TaxID=1151754 RepID=M9MB35_PSEA3|nr:hypothetical protein PANT_6c00087 [Moesziomyces antarcticus T-34]
MGKEKMPDDGVLDLGIALFRALARLGWRGAAARRSAAQLGAAQRIIVVINRITAAQRSTNSTRQRLDSSSAPTASQRQRQPRLARHHYFRPRPANLFIVAQPAAVAAAPSPSPSSSTHSPTHSINLPALLCVPRTLILLQGLASSFVTSASARSSPFSARPPGSIAPPRPDLIALTCSSDCTCTSTRADCPAPACTIIHRSQQTPLSCRAVSPSYRTAPCLTHRHRHLTLIPGPCIQPNHAPDHLDPHSPHCLLVISSTSQLPRLLDTSKL